MQLPKVNVCRTSTVATTTTRAFPNGGSATDGKTAVKETTNSFAPDAAMKSSGTLFSKWPALVCCVYLIVFAYSLQMRK